jgi:exportin-2 (importin alpha re-exporter)
MAMQSTPENAQMLRGLFLNSLSYDNNARKAAESQLQGNFMGMQPVSGFPTVLLMLIRQLSTPGAGPEDMAIRQSASIFFKNLVKKRWILPKRANANGVEECYYPAQQELEEDEVFPIGAEDRDPVKSLLVDLLCTTPVDVQKQLAESMSIVSSQDFPHQWQGLLPQLVEKLKTADFYVIKGVMLTANSIMKRFRHVYKSDELYEVLIVCLEGFQEPLLKTYQASVAAIEQYANDKESLKAIFESLRLMTRIFFSLNWQDLPEYFENNIRAWMEAFLSLLLYKNPLLEDDDEENEPGPIDSLKTAIVENLDLYVMKYEDEFKDYLPAFTQKVWQLLLEVGMAPKFDNLATSGIKFLTSVSSKKLNMHIFTSDASVLPNLIEHIVVKNLTARESDEELFEDNPSDYIRKDMEGSDQDTRRRCAIELVRSLLKFFGPQVSELCVSYITGMLEEYRKTMNWHAKDSALHLALACAVTNSSATELNPLVNINDIFATHILPEIQDPNDVDSRPIVKADAIKMICIFRTHLPQPFLLQLLPSIINHLKSKAVVIQTYAAMSIERFLSIKDKVMEGGVEKQIPRITKDHITGHSQTMMAELFTVLENPDYSENDYVMKCIMRLLVVLGTEIIPLTELVLQKLTIIFERVAKQPINPHYNHYLFECYAVFIKSVCLDSKSADEVVNGACDQFEAMLFPPFQAVLTEDITEFTPYVFQLLAQLLSYRPGTGISAPYKALFPPVLSPQLWERKGNVPALTDLLCTYLRRGADFVVANKSLEGVLGIFQQLLSSRSTDQYASKVIDTVFMHVSHSDLAQYIPTIFNLLLRSLQGTMKNARAGAAVKNATVKRFFHSLCVFASSFGGKALIDDGLEAIDRGVAATLIAQVIEPKTAMFVGTCSGMELRRMIVGGTRILTESQTMGGSPEAWGGLARALVAVIVASDKKPIGAAATTGISVLAMMEGPEDAAESREFDSTYSRLVNAAMPAVPATVEMQQGSGLFISTLQSFCQSRPGVYLPLLKGSLGDELGTYFQKLLHQHGAQLV